MNEFVSTVILQIYFSAFFMLAFLGTMYLLTSDNKAEDRISARIILVSPIWPLALIPFLLWLAFRKD